AVQSRAMRIFAFLPLLLLAPTMSADEVTVWPSARLKAYAAELAPKVNEQQYALERLEDFGSHYVMMVHRLDDGPAEVHDAVTDFYVVQGGTGTLHFGGTVVDGKVTEPGEIRGASLKGSQTRKL